MIYNTQQRIKTRWLSHLWCWCSGFLYFVAIVIEIVPWQVRWWWKCQRPQFHPQSTMSKHNKMQLNDSSLIIINIYIQYTVYIHIYIMHSSKHSQPCLLVRGLQSLSSVGHHVSRVEAGTEGRRVCHALLIELITGCWEETASDVSCHSGRAVCPHPPDKTGASSY